MDALGQVRSPWRPRARGRARARAAIRTWLRWAWVHGSCARPERGGSAVDVGVLLELALALHLEARAAAAAGPSRQIAAGQSQSRQIPAAIHQGAPSPGFGASRSAGRTADRAISSPLPGYCPASEYHVITREQTHAFHASLMEASPGGGGSVLTKINMNR